MTVTLFEVLNKKGRPIARVDADVAARMAEEVNGSCRPYTVEGATDHLSPVVKQAKPVTATPARRVTTETATTAWGTQTTRVTRQPRQSRVPGKPSERQTAFLRTLLAERSGMAGAEQVRDDLNRAREDGSLTGQVVSLAITQLMAIRRPQSSQPDLPDVPAGWYALEGDDGTLRFYKVDRPSEGRWAGRTFVRQIAGPNEYPVRGAAATEVLGTVAKDPEAAAQRYGQEIGKCGRCGRRLTNDESRAFGIGPECREKGW